MAKRRRGEPPSGTPRKAAAGRTAGEFRAQGTVQTALIRGNTFAVKAVQYVEVDGLAIFEGDIVLGTADEVAQMSDSCAQRWPAEWPAGRRHHRGRSSAGPTAGCRSPSIAALPNQARVTDAIAHWEANTGYRFVARTTEADFVTFRPGSGCSSSVGRRGGQQFVNLARRLLHGQRDPRDRPRHRPVARAEPRRPRPVRHDQLGQDHSWHRAQLQPAHHRRRRYRGLRLRLDHALPADCLLGRRHAIPSRRSSRCRPASSSASVPDCRQATSQRRTVCARKPLKESPADTLKEIAKEVTKELVKEAVCDTIKELIKDIRLDTRKELILDTLKEQMRDTFKEGPFDPGPTIAEAVITPGRATSYHPVP